MFGTKWSPVFAPEGDAAGGVEGTEINEGVTREVPMNERPVDGPGSGRGEIRRQLEKNFDTDRKNRDAAEKAEAKAAKKPAAKGGYRSRAAEMQEATSGEEAEGAVEGETEGQEQAEGDGQEQQVQGDAPAAFSKEAKAEWANAPASIRAAVLKREDDVTKGVAALKQNYAEIDTALKPHMGVIQQQGHTAGSAVNQLFAWFGALSQDRARLSRNEPPIAFLALAKSFGLDPRQILAGLGQAQGQQGQQEQQGQQQAGEQEALPPAVQAHIQKLEGQLGQLTEFISTKIGGMETAFSQQSQQKTDEVLSLWAKDKPYFEDVRKLMGRLIASGEVEPLPNGMADLDKAYDMALYANPGIRAKVYADQQKRAADEQRKKAEAEKAAQQTQANKARRTNVALGPGAPPSDAAPQARSKKASKSVRESLKEAMDELNG